MKRNWAMGGLCALVLAGCGLVPPIQVGDALQLGGKSTTVSLTNSSNSASIQSTGSLGGSSATFTFADDPNINIALTPSSFEYTLAISRVSFGSGCVNPLPASVAVTVTNLKATLSDPAFTNAATQPSATAASVGFTITNSGGNLSVTNLTGNNISFNNLGNVGTILKGGGTNTLTLTGTVTTNPDVATAGGTCTLTITWGAGNGTVKL